MRYFLLSMSMVFCFSLSGSANAKSSGPLMTVRVIKGEKVSKFELKPNGKNLKLVFENNGGIRRETILTQKSFSYLVDQFETAPVIDNAPRRCPRSIARFSYQSSGRIKAMSACIGDRTQGSEKATRVLNLLSDSL